LPVGDAQLSGRRDLTRVDVGHFLAQQVHANLGVVEPVSAVKSGTPIGSTPQNTTLDSSYILSKYGLLVADGFEVIAGFEHRAAARHTDSNHLNRANLARVEFVELS
jgi:hypothetical protein